MIGVRIAAVIFDGYLILRRCHHQRKVMKVILMKNLKQSVPTKSTDEEIRSLKRIDSDL